MIQKPRNPILFLLGIGLIFLSACGQSSHKLSEPVSMIHPVNFKPLDYFDQHCARCHGTNGANYGDEFGKDLTDAELVDFVDSMAAGPGEAPLEGENLKALTAFHRSLADGNPFLILTQISGHILQGETMQDAKVSLAVGDTIISATRDGANWYCTLPAGLDPKSLWALPILTAIRNEKTTELDLSKNAFSHSQPIVRK